MRDSVVFYRSFADAIRALPEADQLKALWAVIDYGLDEKVPEDFGVHTAIYIMAKPQIDANNKRYQNGNKGGKPKTKAEPNGNLDITKVEPNCNQTVTKTEPKHNQSITKAKPKEKENVNVKENVNEKQNMCDAVALFERLWKMYPCKKGKGQVSDTQKKRLLSVGEPALVKAIERYSSELKKDADWRKPQNGSTFFNSGYIDYLDDNFVPDKQQAVLKVKSTGFTNFKERDNDYAELQKALLMKGLE